MSNDGSVVGGVKLNTWVVKQKSVIIGTGVDTGIENVDPSNATVLLPLEGSTITRVTHIEARCSAIAREVGEVLRLSDDGIRTWAAAPVG